MCIVIVTLSHMSSDTYFQVLELTGKAPGVTQGPLGNRRKEILFPGT